MRDPIDLIKADRDFWRALTEQLVQAIDIGGDGNLAIDEDLLEQALATYQAAVDA